ncbi:hypothetical protein ACFPIJ_47120 [Dactylosporangium cerinum]|uniref:Uncharacterized protein n=1 Tax=Dactylosporangium cerinum TaxID=1434730 RepID=A0ABV9WB02_9ACTN
MTEQRHVRSDVTSPLAAVGPVVITEVPAAPGLAAIPDDPATWPAHAAMATPDRDSSTILAAITDLLGVRALTAQQRATLLRVLATWSAITGLGPSSDQQHRTGWGFRFAADSVSIDLIVDTATGEVLSHRLATPTEHGPTPTMLLLHRTRCDPHRPVETPAGPTW